MCVVGRTIHDTQQTAVRLCIQLHSILEIQRKFMSLHGSYQAIEAELKHGRKTEHDDPSVLSVSGTVVCHCQLIDCRITESDELLQNRLGYLKAFRCHIVLIESSSRAALMAYFDGSDDDYYQKLNY